MLASFFAYYVNIFNQPCNTAMHETNNIDFIINIVCKTDNGFKQYNFINCNNNVACLLNTKTTTHYQKTATNKLQSCIHFVATTIHQSILLAYWFPKLKLFINLTSQQHLKQFPFFCFLTITKQIIKITQWQHKQIHIIYIETYKNIILQY